MPSLTEYAKVVILSKLEEGWSIRRLAQYNNIAKSAVQRIKQTLLWCSKISTTFMLSNLPNLKFGRHIFIYSAFVKFGINSIKL
jgi:hypothetical protein